MAEQDFYVGPFGARIPIQPDADQFTYDADGNIYDSQGNIVNADETITITAKKRPTVAVAGFAIPTWAIVGGAVAIGMWFFFVKKGARKKKR